MIARDVWLGCSGGCRHRGLAVGALRHLHPGAFPIRCATMEKRHLAGAGEQAAVKVPQGYLPAPAETSFFENYS